MQPSFAVAEPVPAVKRTRIESIDLLRGLVIIIMALDHVRDYFNGSAYLFDPSDLSQTNVPLFFTRWITHFCAPIFSFLAGTSAFLSGVRKTKRQQSRFLLTRGLWLVILEVFVISFGWTFNSPSNIIILQVIWALGISMIALAGLIYLPQKAIIIIGFVLIAGHDLLDNVHVPGSGIASFSWGFLHERGYFTFMPFPIQDGYPVLPWIGIMALGYCIGSLYTADKAAAKRKKTLTQFGIAAILLFVVIRAVNIYGDNSPWQTQPSPIYTFLSFLNVSKYPPSLLYILVTLGPALLFLAYTEKPLNAITQKIAVFGRVPMFFYIIHIYIIHAFAMLAAVLTGFNWHDMIAYRWVTQNEKLKGYGFNLAVVYLIWVVLIVALYPLCKKYDIYKRANQAKKWWLSYL